MPFPYSTSGRVEERWRDAGPGRCLLQLVWKDDAGAKAVFHRISRSLVGVLDRIVGHGPDVGTVYRVFLFSALGVDVLLGEGDTLPGLHNEKVIVKLLSGTNLSRPIALLGPHWFRMTANAANLAGALDIFYWNDLSMALESRMVS